MSSWPLKRRSIHSKLLRKQNTYTVSHASLNVYWSMYACCYMFVYLSSLAVCLSKMKWSQSTKCTMSIYSRWAHHFRSLLTISPYIYIYIYTHTLDTSFQCIHDKVLVNYNWVSELDMVIMGHHDSILVTHLSICWG